MSNNTPEALRLARMIEHYNAGVESQRIVEDYQQAAYELRRLYFENEKFRASLAEQPGHKLVPEVPTTEWINNLARRRTGSFEHVPFAEIHQSIVELLESAPEAPQLKAEQPAEQSAKHMELVRGEWQGYTWNPYAIPQPAKPAEQEPRPCHVFNVTKNGSLTEWESTTMAFALPDGKYALYTAPHPAKQPLTDEEIDNTTRKQVDDLLDHIYEYGTAAEGIIERVRAIARAIERAHSIGEHE